MMVERRESLATGRSTTKVSLSATQRDPHLRSGAQPEAGEAAPGRARKGPRLAPALVAPELHRLRIAHLGVKHRHGGGLDDLRRWRGRRDQDVLVTGNEARIDLAGAEFGMVEAAARGRRHWSSPANDRIVAGGAQPPARPARASIRERSPWRSSDRNKARSRSPASTPVSTRSAQALADVEDSRAGRWRAESRSTDPRHRAAPPSPSRRSRARPGASAASRPLATRSCHSTRSWPVISSVTGCSTWSRVFISMNQMRSARRPSLASAMNSIVPAPT